MKKIVYGKIYNTETAVKIGSYEKYAENPSDWKWYKETLYQKATGEYFLYGKGNKYSKYGVFDEQNKGLWSRDPGEDIIPITETEAYAWKLQLDPYYQEASELYFRGLKIPNEKELMKILHTDSTEKVRNIHSLLEKMDEFDNKIAAEKEQQSRERIQKEMGSTKKKIELSMESHPSNWEVPYPYDLEGVWVTSMGAVIHDKDGEVTSLYAEVDEPSMLWPGCSDQERSDQWKRFDVEAYFILKAAIIDQAENLGISSDQLQWPDKYGLDKYQDFDEYALSNDFQELAPRHFKDQFTLRYRENGRIINKSIEATQKTMTPIMIHM